MRAVVAIALLAAAPALADPARPADVRFGIGVGHGSGRESTFGAPQGTTIGALFDAGMWVSDHVTFGVHLGGGAFQESEDDPSNTPHHSRSRYSYVQTHATFLVHWDRVVAGGGIGLDFTRNSLLETDGMSRTDTDTKFFLGAHLQAGVDIVRLGPGMLGAFGILTTEPVPVAYGIEHQLSSVLGGLSYVLRR